MSSMKLAAACLLLFFCLAEARPQEKPQSLCGRSLAEALTIYCYGVNPDSPQEDKRRIQINSASSESEQQLWPWLIDYSQAREKRLPGIVEECCLRPCSIKELLSYC